MTMSSLMNHTIDTDDDEYDYGMNDSKLRKDKSFSGTPAPSWGSFSFAKRLSLITPKYDTMSDDEGEDMFSVFKWSNDFGKDQFPSQRTLTTVSSKKQEKFIAPQIQPDSTPEEVVKILSKTAQQVEELNTEAAPIPHRRSRRKVSIGVSKPFSTTSSDEDRRITNRRDRYARSRERDHMTEYGTSGEEAIYSSSGSETRPKNSTRRSALRRNDSSNSQTREITGASDVSRIRTKWRNSMSMMTTYDGAESVHVVNGDLSSLSIEGGEHRSSGVRISRRNSMSGSSTVSSSLSRMDLPKPRPLDTSLYPIAANMPTRLPTTTTRKHECFHTPEPSASGRMLRRGSMPTMNTFVHDMPFTNPSDKPSLDPNKSNTSRSTRSQQQKPRRRSMSHTIPEDSTIVTTMPVTNHPSSSKRGDHSEEVSQHQRSLRRRKSNDDVWEEEEERNQSVHHPIRTRPNDSQCNSRKSSPTERTKQSKPTSLEPRLLLHRTSRRSSM
jgi:hypothetical protein